MSTDWTAICDPDCIERDRCHKAGYPGHVQCGHCDTHDKPTHHCGCWAAAIGATEVEL